MLKKTVCNTAASEVGTVPKFSQDTVDSLQIDYPSADFCSTFQDGSQRKSDDSQLGQAYGQKPRLLTTEQQQQIEKKEQNRRKYGVIQKYKKEKKKIQRKIAMTATQYKGLTDNIDGKVRQQDYRMEDYSGSQVENKNRDERGNDQSMGNSNISTFSIMNQQNNFKLMKDLDQEILLNRCIRQYAQSGKQNINETIQTLVMMEVGNHALANIQQHQINVDDRSNQQVVTKEELKGQIVGDNQLSQFSQHDASTAGESPSQNIMHNTADFAKKARLNKSSEKKSFDLKNELLYTISEAIMSQLSDSDLQDQIEDSMKSSIVEEIDSLDSDRNEGDNKVVISSFKKPIYFGPNSIRGIEKVLLSSTTEKELRISSEVKIKQNSLENTLKQDQKINGDQQIKEQIRNDLSANLVINSIDQPQKIMESPMSNGILQKDDSKQKLQHQRSKTLLNCSFVDLYAPIESNKFNSSKNVVKQNSTNKTQSKDDSETSLRNKSIDKRRLEPRRRQSSVISTTKIKKVPKRKQDSSKKQINQYLFERELGKGTFSSVHLCKDLQKDTYFAVKKMNRRNLQRKPFGKGRTAYDCIKEELKVLERLEHPNIIWLHEIIDDPKRDHIYLVTEYHSRGSLGDQIVKLNEHLEKHNDLCKKEKRFEDMQTVGMQPRQVREYLKDMVKALHYCHRVIGVIHRDIKPDNIMINHNDEAVLIDFGVSALCEETDQDLLDRKMGTYMFFAPEMFNATAEETQTCSRQETMTRGEKTDIWALGISFYYLLTGQYPYVDAVNPIHIKELILNREINFKLIKHQPAQELLKKMLSKDPSQRCTLEDIAQSAWISNNGRDCFDFKVEYEDNVNSQENCNSRALTLANFGNFTRLIKKHQSQRTIFEQPPKSDV